MRFNWSGEAQGSLWLAPGLLGVILIGLGVLLYVMPELLAYFVAGLFVVAGCGLIGTAWRMRRRVTYQRIDRQWRVHDSPDNISEQ